MMKFCQEQECEQRVHWRSCYLTAPPQTAHEYEVLKLTSVDTLDSI